MIILSIKIILIIVCRFETLLKMKLFQPIGRPKAPREVGRAMRFCPEHLPSQRVVMADGSIAGGNFMEIRKAILKSEGVPFLSDDRVDMEACRWKGHGGS